MAVHDIYHALGDPVRLELVERLVTKGEQPTTELVAGLGMTRQAATKHLVVLENAGLVESEARGRQVIRRVRRQALQEAETWLSQRARMWETRLGALARKLENDNA
jgi:DNA-binding transcriptional ArsR family regulator